MSRDRDRWEPVAVQAARDAGIDPALFVALIDTESGWDPDARSFAGAVGIAQIVPRWHPNVDARDPYASLQYAARLLASHLREFGSERLALAAYNAGPGAVHSVGNRVPDNGETPAYVDHVLRLRAEMAETAVPDVVIASSEVDAPSVSARTNTETASTVVAALASPEPHRRRNIALIATAIATMVLLLVVTE